MPYIEDRDGRGKAGRQTGGMLSDYEDHAIYGRLNLKRSAKSESGYEDVCPRKKAGVVISFYGK